jgi:4-hydroxy-tetrahydrodipicolinate synthase
MASQWKPSFTRRQFLVGSLSCFGSIGLSFPLLSADLKPTSLTPQEFQSKIAGPILSVPTCFQHNKSIDHDSMKRVVDLGIRSGCRIVTLTAGNNQYDALAYDEIKQLTQKMIEAVNGRAIFIAAAGRWKTAQVVQYAKFAHRLGADALQVTLPQVDDDQMSEHMRAIADATPVGIVLHGDPKIELLTRLLQIDSIVAFKEEYTTIYSLQLYRAFGKRLTLFAGGEKARLLTYYPYGMRAWYSTFMTFAPSVAIEFQRAIEERDLQRAGDVVLRYETPVFQRFSLPFWRATLEHFGLASRWCRSPDKSFSDEQLAEVGRFFDQLGLIRKTSN